MNKVLILSLSTLVSLIGLFAGCSASTDSATEDATEQERWPEVKEETQLRELEIARAIPADWVTEIEQSPDGFLLSCSSGDFGWHGRTTVVLAKGVDSASVVKRLESLYETSDFTLGTRYNVLDQYELQLIAPDGIENYIIAEWEPGTLRIASGSPCFALPEGEYPGGTW